MYGVRRYTIDKISPFTSPFIAAPSVLPAPQLLDRLRQSRTTGHIVDLGGEATDLPEVPCMRAGDVVGFRPLTLE